MKKFILICSIFYILSFQCVYGSDIENRTKLINNYINNLKNEINIILDKYNIKEVEVKEELSEINNILKILDNMQYKSYTQEEYNQIIEIILYRIKENKDKIKNIVTKQQEEYKKILLNKKKKYSQLGIKLNKQFDTIITKYYNIYQKKENITYIDTQIIKILKNLSNESLKLKNFGLLSFDSIEEMNNTFAQILKNIKKEMISLKSLK